jgi:hypothetical protein
MRGAYATTDRHLSRACACGGGDDYTVRSPQDPLYTTFGCGYNPDSPQLAGAEQNFEYGYDDDIDHGDTLRGSNFDSCSGDCQPEPPELVEQWVE